MAYEDFKDLTRRTAFDKILFDNAFNIAKNVLIKKTSAMRAKKFPGSGMRICQTSN